MRVTSGASSTPLPGQVTEASGTPMPPAAGAQPAPAQPAPAQALLQGDSFSPAPSTEGMPQLSPPPGTPVAAPAAASPQGTGAQPGSTPPGAPAAAPAAASPQGKAAQSCEDPPENEATAQQARRGWRDTSGSVAQTTATDCGGASVAYLNRADGSREGATQEQLRREVRKRVVELNNSGLVRTSQGQINLSNGATPEEMGGALGAMGIGVVRGMGSYDAQFMSQSLGNGQLGMALVDSSALESANVRPRGQPREPGELHWVVIDGIDSGRWRNDRMDDRFRVKDPVNGTYWLTARQLQGVLDQTRQHHGGGGLLVVEARPDVQTLEQRANLAMANMTHTGAMGNKPGIGSSRFNGSVSN